MSEERGLLIDSLWQDARREAEEITARARDEGEALLAQAREAGERAREEARERGLLTAAPEAARIRNRGLRQTAGALLLRRQQMLDALFDGMERELEEGRWPGKEMADALEPLLDELLQGVPRKSRGEVTVRPADGRRCRTLLAARGYSFTVREDPAVRGGASLVLGEGCEETRDNTLRSRLAALRADPPLPLFPILFPSPLPPGER